MPELLWLLLPLAAASGWWAARRSAARPPCKSSSELKSDYFRGLNFLLNEQPDKAIDVFIQMLEVDSDTVETHLALGNLFRRRGEVDRAIRIHQNLIARPSLDQQQRSAALLELCQDYMRAGLFDRAESLLKELLEIGHHRVSALRHLLDIYQQEKEWEEAITIARRLESQSGQDMKPVIAQFHCELAEAALGHGDTAEVENLARKALSIDRRCVRASLILGRISKAAGQYKQAIRALRRVEEQDLEFLPEVLEDLRECHEALGAPQEMVSYLRQVDGRYRGTATLLMLADLLQQHEGEAAAMDYLAEVLRERPSLRGLDRFISLQFGNAEEDMREDLAVLQGLVQRLLETRPRYKCCHCGFEGQSLHWQCPSCKYWNTVKPIHGIEGEQPRRNPQ